MSIFGTSYLQFSATPPAWCPPRLFLRQQQRSLPRRSDIKESVKKNVVFLGMLLGMGFLLTVSLVVSAGIARLGKFLNGFLPAPEFLPQMMDFLLSVGTITLLFAAMYRFLPNTKVEWSDVWIGAAFTSLLFSVGKLGLGLYIGKSSVSSSYGAASRAKLHLPSGEDEVHSDRARSCHSSTSATFYPAPLGN